MKKSMYLVAGLLTIGLGSAFTSCSNDEDINPGMEQVEEGTQVLTLSVANGGDGLQSRAGRPLLSSAADQDIQQVVLYFVQTSEGTNKGKCVLTKWVDWENAVDYADGKQLEVALKKENSQKLSDGTYTVYAVGYSGTGADATDYTFTPAAIFSDAGNVFQSTGTDWNGFQAKLNEANAFAEEVFAGELTGLTVDVNGSFNLNADGTKNTVVLHRQVAGATGYFANIPVEVDGKNTRYVRLVAASKNQTVKFENFNTNFTNNPGANDGTVSEGAEVKYIVNGADPVQTADAKFVNGVDAYTVYLIDVSQWFSYDVTYTGKGYRGYDYNKDGFLGPQDVEAYLADQVEAGNIDMDDLKDYSYSAIWKNPNKSKGQSVYRGTVFGAEFVVPILKKDGQNTLQLQILDGDKNILKYWNINVTKDQLHEQGTGSAEAGEVFDTSISIYNLYRNHMYSVGMKANNTTPDNPDPDPSDPDPEIPDDPDDEEDPEDLSKGQDLILRVNDNWEIIHKMEVD